MDEVNLCESSNNPSFSGTHSLSNGFSIVIFIRTHCTNFEFYQIHRSHGYHLILGPDMFVIWRNTSQRYKVKTSGRSKLHWARSNTHYCIISPTVPMIDQQDIFFDNAHARFKIISYCWRDGSPRVYRWTTRPQSSYGTSLYRLVDHLCPQYDNQNGTCYTYQAPATVIDLQPKKYYQTGETIIGNLKTYEWILLRGVAVSDTVQSMIKDIGNRGRWKVLAYEINREMRNDINSPIYPYNMEWFLVGEI